MVLSIGRSDVQCSMQCSSFRPCPTRCHVSDIAYTHLPAIVQSVSSALTSSSFFSSQFSFFISLLFFSHTRYIVAQFSPVYDEQLKCQSWSAIYFAANFTSSHFVHSISTHFILFCNYYNFNYNNCLYFP